MNAYLSRERTNHVFRPFGCDMSNVDAKMNYKIMDTLFEVWENLGFNKDMEIRWSTPTRYLKAMKAANEGFKADNTSKTVGWPIRRDDTFPYA